MISLSSLMAVTISFSMSAVSSSVEGSQPEAVSTAANAQPEAVAASRGQWLDTFTEARAIARDSGLPILIHFEASWCGACRQMESSVMHQPQVLEHLGQAVIGVRIDADRSPELISQFGISSLPTEVVLDGDGRELHRFVGGASLTEYSSRLEAMKPDASNSDGGTGADALSPEMRECLLVKHDGKIVGLGGYSPIAMIRDKQWERGSEDFVGSFLGVDYFFQSAEERELFFASPEQFIPRLHGCDPVELQRENLAAAGAIELGAFYKGRLFFFLSEANRQRFQNNPAWYVDALRSEELESVEKSPLLQQMILN